MAVRTFTAILHKEGGLYVAECPEVGTVSQGHTVEETLGKVQFGLIVLDSLNSQI